MENRDLRNREYIQFSKKLAKWTIISLVFVVVAAYVLISFAELDMEHVKGIVDVAQMGATAISVIVATYMGNSGVEKMATAKYQANKIVNREDDEGDGAG